MANASPQVAANLGGAVDAVDAGHRAPESFPQFLKLPFELQVNVWLEAFADVSSQPSIQFYNIKVHVEYHDTSSDRWHPALKACASSKGDSAFRIHEDIAAICPSATRALKISGGGREALDGQMHLMDKKTDLLCLRPNLILPSTLDYVTWHLDHQQRRDIKIERPQTRRAFGGFQKVGIAYHNSCRKPPNSWIFACGKRRLLALGHPSYSNAGGYCCRDFAGFIDCFPDIKEFFLVLSSPIGVKSGQGPPSEGPDDNHTVTKGREMYAGRTGRYLEMNRGEYGPPLCGKCPDPWDLVDKTRAILCDEYFTWRLSRKQRRKIKFTLLLKENAAARPED